MSTGAIGALTSYLEGLKRTAKRNFGDMLSSPGDFGRMAASRMDEDMTKRLKDPTSALDYTTGPVGGLAGIIRRGGRPELNMVHNAPMTPDELADLISRRSSLSSPSIAIAKDTIYPFEASSTFVFNPASPLFDPAQHRGNQLFNRDAYTFRGKDPRDIDSGVRNKFKDMRLTEGYMPDETQTLAIRSSPQFRSFAEYEGSKSGARTLGKFTDRDKAYADLLSDNLTEWMQNKYSRSPNKRSSVVLGALRDSARAGDENARFILEEFRKLPSKYAELKVLGEVPVNPRNVSAVVLRDSDLKNYPAEVALLRKAVEDRGVRVGTPRELLPTEHRGLYDDTVGAIGRYLQKHQGNLKSAPSFAETPAVVQRYLDEDLYRRTLNGWADVDRDLPEYIYGSPQFGAEVAGFLTTKDAGYAQGGLVGRQDFGGVVGYILD